MTPIDGLLFNDHGEGSEAWRSVARLAEHGGLRFKKLPLPTHLAQVTWTTSEYRIRWVVLLHSDDTAAILETDPSTGLQFNGLAAANRLLEHFGILVKTGGIPLGNDHPRPPRLLNGVFPGDEEFASLLADPQFVRWMKRKSTTITALPPSRLPHLISVSDSLIHCVVRIKFLSPYRTKLMSASL